MSKEVTVLIFFLMVWGIICYPRRDHAHSNGVSQQRPKLMVIMIDAFRYDYVERPELVGFRKFLSSGSRSRFVEPVFPSKTYPNMFTQVTGMYTESHGVVDNNMYDPDEDELFFASGAPSGTTHKVDAEGLHSFWWNQSEPIWITAERNGLRSGIYYWEGCQTEIHRVNVTFCAPYKSLVSMDKLDYETHYDEVIRDSLLNLKNDTWDLAMIYYELVDATGHANFIDTPAFRNALMITDNILLKLLTLIELNGLKDIVNVILVSDHGMSFRKESDFSYIVNLTDYLRDWHDYDPYIGSGTIVQLFPKPEVYNEVYKNLTRNRIPGMKVYSKAELPHRFGIKRNRRTAPIILVAETGHNINNFGAGWTEHGLHGFDPAYNPEMRAIFAGTGPAFKSGFVSKESMIMTDHFNVFCHVLDISCHANNGSIDRVQDMFRKPAAHIRRPLPSEATTTGHSVFTLLFTMIAAAFH